MDQMNLSDCISDGINMSDSLRDVLIKEIADPQYSESLILADNTDGSVSIWAKSQLAAKVKVGKKASFIEFKPKNNDVFLNFEVKTTSTENSRVYIDGLSDALSMRRQLCVLYIRALSELGGETFGCCHRYTECSDARKCLHPNFITSQACAYKVHLEAGRIFYGKNKNT